MRVCFVITIPHYSENDVSEYYCFLGYGVTYRRASDKIFIEGTIQTVAKIGIENIRTKDVAEYAGFSEATMYRLFPTKEILLRDTFLYLDKQVSSILTQSAYFRKPDDTPFELALYAILHKVFRYLIGHKEETIFLICYRYSSLYTEDVRSKRQAYNGGFDKAYEAFEKHFGSSDQSYREYLLTYIFEMTLCFAEKVITGKLEDNQKTEQGIWLAVSSPVKSWVIQQGGYISDEQRIEATQQAGSA